MGALYTTCEGIYFIKEYRGGRIVPRHLEEYAHHLLRVASVLGGERRRRDVEEGGVALSRHGLGQHGLASSRRTKHEHAAPGTANTCTYGIYNILYVKEALKGLKVLPLK